MQSLQRRNCRQSRHSQTPSGAEYLSPRLPIFWLHASQTRFVRVSFILVRLDASAHERHRASSPRRLSFREYSRASCSFPQPLHSFHIVSSFLWASLRLLLVLRRALHIRVQESSLSPSLWSFALHAGRHRFLVALTAFPGNPLFSFSPGQL